MSAGARTQSTDRWKLRKWLIPFFALTCLILDLVCKSLARQALQPGVRTPFIPFVLRLCLTTNSGAAFSLGSSNGPLMTCVATSVTLGLLIWIAKRLKSDPSNLERAGLGCLLGGACGNLVDRFATGHVTDFLDFAFIDFPVFNVADVCIDTGIGLIVIAMLGGEKAPDGKNEAS